MSENSDPEKSVGPAEPGTGVQSSAGGNEPTGPEFATEGGTAAPKGKLSVKTVWSGFRAMRLRKAIASPIMTLNAAKSSPCIMTIRPTESAQKKGVPDPREFHGLSAILVVSAPSNETCWRFFWATTRAADRYESKIAQYGVSGEVTREVVWWAELPKKPMTLRLASLGAVFGIFGSVAVVLMNLDAINASLTRLFRSPEMTLQPHKSFQVDSRRKEFREIKIGGDPFVRSRLVDLTMRLVKKGRDDDSPPVNAPPATPVAGSDRPVGAGQLLTLILRFNKVPPGRYRVELVGHVRTTWPWQSTKFAESLQLDSRRRVEVRTGLTTLDPQSPAGGRAQGAFVDMNIFTGHIPQKPFNVLVNMGGYWIDGRVPSVYLPSGVTARVISKNTSLDPKNFVFRLDRNSIGSWSREHARVWLQAKVPMTRTQWNRAITHVRVTYLSWNGG